MGRAGDGPGEFRNVQNILAFPADSLGVYDAFQRRLTVFGRGGEVGRVISLADLARGGMSHVLSRNSDLVLLMVAGFSPSPGQTSGAFRGHAPSYRIDQEGNILTSYGEFAGNDMFFFEGMAGT